MESDELFCKYCQCVKPLSAFAPRISKYTGRLLYLKRCRACAARVARQWYWQHRDRARARMKLYSRAHVGKRVVRSAAPVGASVGKRGRPARKMIDGRLRCGRCADWKLPEEFEPNRQSVSGRESACRACRRQAARLAYRRKHPKSIYYPRPRRRKPAPSKVEP